MTSTNTTSTDRVTAPPDTDASGLDDAVARAVAAAAEVAGSTDQERADWLEAVAAALDEAVDDLVVIADAETALGTTRLRGEVGRTTGQLRLFADVVREGSWHEAVIDHADGGTPDVRRVLVPLGPVAVFAASNFPFAFSLWGGDTASALAAGCPVVAKAHPGHPRLSARVDDLTRAALDAAGAPDGTFGAVYGMEAGRQLVQHPGIRAVGFTGSLAGGRALFDLAVGRADPIPFYGELGSVNPVVITPGALAARRDEVVAGLVESFTLGAGQFCTNPGLVFVPSGADLGRDVAAALATDPVPMLHDGIADAFAERIGELAKAGLGVVAGTTEQSGREVVPTVFATTAARLADDPGGIVEECFGPSTVLVDYDDLDQVVKALAQVPPSLAMAVHATDDEVADVAGLVRFATARTGRVIWNGWPTGVAVNWAMHHGGPWPATTAPLHTSVGATAIRRFVRPVAYQDMPAPLLPPAVRDDNPLDLPRRLDGDLHLPG